MSKMHYSSDKF